MIANPDAKFVLQAGDIAYVFSKHTRIKDKEYLFAASEQDQI